MSATSYYLQSHLDTRSQYAKAGVRKEVKTGLARVERKLVKQHLAGEIQTMVTVNASRDLRDMTAAELEEYADQLLQGSRLAEDYSDANGSNDLSLEFFSDETAGVSSALLGSLPDWMILQIEDANGNAFALLSLFEAKSPSPKAAISMEDEVMYA